MQQFTVRGEVYSTEGFLELDPGTIITAPGVAILCQRDDSQLPYSIPASYLDTIAALTRENDCLGESELDVLVFKGDLHISVDLDEFPVSTIGPTQTPISGLWYLYHDTPVKFRHPTSVTDDDEDGSRTVDGYTVQPQGESTTTLLTAEDAAAACESGDLNWLAPLDLNQRRDQTDVPLPSALLGRSE